MKTVLILAVAALLGTAGAAAAGKESNDGKNADSGSIEQSFRNVPTPQFPARAIELIEQADAAEREETAQEILRLVSDRRPGAFLSVVSSIVATHPDLSESVLDQAKTLSPKHADRLEQIGQSVPGKVAAENRGSGKNEAGPRGTPPGQANVPPGRAKAPVKARRGSDVVAENRPATPPGAERSNRPEVTPGNDRGNRPGTPPGLVRDPKPGRDPQGPKNYGRP